MVYNSKTQLCREVVITPSQKWGGQGLLGVSIRFCAFEGANENVWHILDVQQGSPASKASLVSDKDFIIGADTILHDVSFSAISQKCELRTAMVTNNDK